MKAEACIFFQLAKTYQQASRFLGRRAAALGLTPVQAMVLGFLAEEDGVTSAALGKRTELDSATLSSLLDRLETAGLVDRRENPDNRRSVRIHLTERGLKLARESTAAIVKANLDYLKDLTTREQSQLRALIVKLRQGGDG